MSNAESQLEPSSESGNSSPIGRKQLVLVAEDNDDDFYLLRRAFQKVGRETDLTRARDGAEVIDYLCRARLGKVAFPEMLLLDLKLPKLSGFEVLKWVREDTVCKFLVVNILSSSAEPSDVRRAFKLGANSYLVKPVRMHAYNDLINTLSKFWLEISKLPEIGTSEK